LAGRVLHPLDDRRSFLKLSHPHSPSTRIAWSHWNSYPWQHLSCAIHKAVATA
jgi:hypothetical protein